MKIYCQVVCQLTSNPPCKVMFEVKEEATVGDVKEVIYDHLQIQFSEQQLKVGDQLMEEDKKLSEYGIHDIQSEAIIELKIIRGSTLDGSQVEASVTTSEIVRIQENYSKFIDAISDPAKFAARLYSAMLITDTLRDKAMNENQPCCTRVMMLVLAVEEKIEAFPQQNFQKFVRVLCDENCCQQLAREIDPNLAEVCMQQIQFESTAKNLVELATELMNESTDPYTSYHSLDEVQCQVREFKNRFYDLTIELKEELCSLIKGGTLKIGRVKQTITRLPNDIRLENERFLDKIIDLEKRILKVCEDVDQLFNHLNEYVSCFNYSLIERLINKHGTRDLKRKMQRYVADMKKFHQRTLVKTFAQVWSEDIENSTANEKFTLLKANLKKDSAHCTLDELDKLRREFCAAYHLPESAVMVHLYCPGSVKIEWLLPVQFTRELMSTIKEVTIEVFCITRNISYFYVGEHKVFSEEMFEEITVEGQDSLIPLLKESGSECLNESDGHPYTNALAPGPLQYLQSDVDAQLIVFLSFQTAIKLHSIQLSGPLDGRSPRTVRLFVNQLNCLGFDEAECRMPAKEIVLDKQHIDEESKDSVIPLDLIKFQNVSNLTIFIKDNQGGGDTTVVHHIGLFGNPVEAIDMSQFRRVVGSPDEVSSCAQYKCPRYDK